jgi:hypothetical protein
MEDKKYTLEVTSYNDGELMECMTCHCKLHPKFNDGNERLYWTVHTFVTNVGNVLEGFLCEACKLKEVFDASTTQ